MIPDSLTTLVSFLLLLAPGIVWQLLQSGHSPSTKESPLVEVSKVVLGSLAATLAAALILLIPFWIPLYQRAVDAGENAFNESLFVIPYAGAVLATSALACVLAALVSLFRWRGGRLRWRGRRAIRGGRVWNQIFVTHRPEGCDSPSLIVELKNGTVWKGLLESFDTDPEDQDRGLALGGDLKRKKIGGSFEAKGHGDRYVVLAESEISSIQVTYPAAPA